MSPGTVVYEHRDPKTTTLWYYVQDADGLAHKFEASVLAMEHPSLVADFERRKSRGHLTDFNPSATNVHPKSRVKITINMSKLTRRAQQAGSSKGMPLVIDSDEEEAEEWDRDVPEGSGPSDGDYSEDTTPAPGRRGLRKQKKLPFSPRKTRHSRQAAAVRHVDEDDDEVTDESPTKTAGARRSTRQRKPVKTQYLDEDFEDDGSEEASDEYSQGVSSRSKGKAKKVIRGKASRPAYGHVRSVADLDYDPHDDEDTTALRAHRYECEKCRRQPAHVLLEREVRLAQKRKGTRKKKDDLEGSDDEETRLSALGGWVRCMKCTLSSHWQCLLGSEREEILKAIRDRDRASWAVSHPESECLPAKRPGLDAQQITEFICSMCSKGGSCMGCMEVALEPYTAQPVKPFRDGKETDAAVAAPDATQRESAQDVLANELLFRCRTCRRLAHYHHLPPPDIALDSTEGEVYYAQIAEYYQSTNGWSCADCASYVYVAEKILAWRPFPANAEQPSILAGEAPNPKVQLPREYLVKWQDRSYRRTQWVHHGWLAAKHAGLLRHFLASGPKVDLLKEALREEEAANAVAEGGIGSAADETTDPAEMHKGRTSDMSWLSANPDAERKIPPAWKTVDRVLDVLMWIPTSLRRKGGKAKGNAKATLYSKRRVDSEEDESEEDDPDQEERDAAFNIGEQPGKSVTCTLDEWEEKRGEPVSQDDISSVVWAFIKWDDLGYDEATWDSPPRPEEPGYSAFQLAFERLIVSRSVVVPTKSKVNQNRAQGGFRKHRLKTEEDQPALGQKENLKLMPFQVEGFNWLCSNWWDRQPCILADEMGLGKTVQIATFVGSIVHKFNAFPVLVVVPNSTITNWVREFSAWAPNLRVVPFYGESKARDVIKSFELKHEVPESGTTGHKFHVLVTTYETLNVPKDFASVFNSVRRWEVLVVDEGQRLKNNSSLLFKKLNQLTIAHRIIMTGTPLNNNIRELFNLMNFLDPDVWSDLEQLEKDHEELTEDLVKQLHARLKPYFLRRMKVQVLKLPPKNEVIVPISLTALQKEVYKSILSRNVNILMELTKSLAQTKTRAGTSLKPGSMVNILMELRKCIQHPYLVSDDIEPKGLVEREAHEKLVAGSGKLRFLQSLLPKLKARGHRVLLFSQFVIALDIVEDFCNGEGIKYLRLDGNTKQADRQKGMDEFNRPGSDVFVYLLTTRAGGVGINLWSADTVIIFDPDFNPHQDLQAIARAHRYGQTKPCLVFKFMAKDTAEERIMQTGKKKMVLDHVIIQKIDDDEGSTDVQSILTFGAKALFEEEGNSRDIVYNDHDIDNLIEKTEAEGEQEEQGNTSEGLFQFAKVWAADKDDLEDVPDEDPEAHEQVDSWALTLKRIQDQRSSEQAKELTGRGVRRKAAVAAASKPQQNLDLDDTPKKSKAKGKKRKSREDSDESDGYLEPASRSPEKSDSDGLGSASDDLVPGLSKQGHKRARTSIPPQALSSPQSHHNELPYLGGEPIDDPLCGLCGERHDGECFMTGSSENLREYRKMLFEATDEPIEERREAIEIIDKTLNRRGDMHLIYGQPLRLVDPGTGQGPTALSTNPGRNSSSPKSRHTAASEPSRPTTPAAASSNARPGPTSGLSNGSSKRPSPSIAEGHSWKRPKTAAKACAACGASPWHDLRLCPVVAEGPSSISKAIARLHDQPEHRDVVIILRKILSKQKKVGR
ncbi:hypothetical protein FA95DRAFT_1517538 [Auriscalpium vulgare]|uniref:Uncharacterized protein n=1 Tax=Auriscalpium vulgare TaxID=40419 RepID=A0ACB8RWD0_9AGAM|nr:hypothetical protein FA95DRAFT_1517538 [Auriscalpium vulgare]